jgi:PmbA protein
MADDADTGADLDLLHDLIGRALRAGADAADAVLFEATSLSHARRLGKTEKLERSESQDLGLRVLVGKQQAIVSSSDRSPKMLDELVARTVAMAKAVPEDPFCGLADPAEVAHDWPSLDMLDSEEPSAETLIERARAAEEAALAVQGITNSEGAEAGWGRSRVALVASNGFAGGYAGSHHGVSVAVIGGAGQKMERDYDFASAVYAADLRDPAEVGRTAGERTVRRLGARKMATARVPVVFDPRVARSFLSHLLGAISGPSIARGTSFLKYNRGQRKFAEAITII